MSAAVEPLLALLRKAMERREVTVAELAQRAGMERARLRRVLKGSEPLTVAELMTLSATLELKPEDLGLPGTPEGVDLVPDGPSLGIAQAPFVPVVDPMGHITEQLFRIAFSLGCDFFFLADTTQLEGSGIPDAVLSRYRGKDFPIKLDAAYHRHNAPRYEPSGVHLRLSFDRVVDCHFPWSAIRQVVFFPPAPDPVPEPAPIPIRPRLRLVE